MKTDLEIIFNVMSQGDIGELEELKEIISDFPNGTDSHGTHWITHSIDLENMDTINWVLTHDVNINFIDNTGYTVLLSTLEVNAKLRYDLLETFLLLGVPVDLTNEVGFTALHRATLNDDLKAFKILIDHGANVNQESVDSTTYEYAELNGSNEVLHWFQQIEDKIKHRTKSRKEDFR
jgi:ankyrin repeat protein